MPDLNAPTSHPASQRTGSSTRIFFLLLGLAILGGGGWYYWTGRGEESTDDAFTDGHAITIAPQVAGTVVSLKVTDNQRVKAGQVLLTIDPRDYQAVRDRDAAALALAKAQLDNARVAAEIARTTYPANLTAAQATRESAAATLARAKADLERQRRVDIRATTPQNIDAALATERAAQASLDQAEADLRKSELVAQNIASADTIVAEMEGQVAQAKATLDQADIQLGYTRVVAPQDGWVTKRGVEQGAYVQTGQSLMSIVSPNVWITANFKESQLRDMRPGQPVTIAIDAYPQLHLTGKVDSIQMGSGSRFTTFPSENATGNYVKIVQRLPVKIDITGGLDPAIPLPLGLSVIPTVRVR